MSIIQRLVTIVYQDGGVEVYAKEPSSQEICVYNNRFYERIPSEISMHLDYSKITIIEKD